MIEGYIKLKSKINGNELILPLYPAAPATSDIYDGRLSRSNREYADWHPAFYWTRNDDPTSGVAAVVVEGGRKTRLVEDKKRKALGTTSSAFSWFQLSSPKNTQYRLRPIYVENSDKRNNTSIDSIKAYRLNCNRTIDSLSVSMQYMENVMNGIVKLEHPILSALDRIEEEMNKGKYFNLVCEKYGDKKYSLYILPNKTTMKLSASFWDAFNAASSIPFEVDAVMRARLDSIRAKMIKDICNLNIDGYDLSVDPDKKYESIYVIGDDENRTALTQNFNSIRLAEFGEDVVIQDKSVGIVPVISKSIDIKKPVCCIDITLSNQHKWKPSDKKPSAFEQVLSSYVAYRNEQRYAVGRSGGRSGLSQEVAFVLKHKGKKVKIAADNKYWTPERNIGR